MQQHFSIIGLKVFFDTPEDTTTLYLALAVHLIILLSLSQIHIDRKMKKVTNKVDNSNKIRSEQCKMKADAAPMLLVITALVVTLMADFFR